MDPFQIGDVIAGKYEITRVLGRGGMGVVVAARHRELGELVALKFLRASLTEKPESYARFAREARTATRIKNEHVARVYDVGTVDGAPFMVMEHLTGEDLAHALRRRGPLPVVEAVDLLLQACEAIADAHNLGVVHRDLKPANLFVTAGSDGTPFVKVLDFGISKSTSMGDLSMTETAAVVGSPLYMSPEQLASSRNVDARADLWALGVILYEMLTGKTPFAGESFATLSAAILRGECTPVSELRPDVPAALAEAIAGALTRDPAGRPSSVAAFAAGIAPCGSDAARASCQRIVRIAARVAPSPEVGEGESGATTVPQAPPSAVARVLEAPGEVTQPPALGTSVAVPARRRLPGLATFAAIAGVATLVVAGTVVGLRSRSAPAASTPAPAAAGETDARTVDSSNAVAADPRWQATQLAVEGFALGDFAVAASPTPEHPQGVLGVLGYTRTDSAKTPWWLLAIDLASGRDAARNAGGIFADGDVVRIAHAPRGVVVAHQHEAALDLHWYTDGTVEADTRSLPQLASKRKEEVRGFASFDDRIVLATGGYGTTTVWILDEKGRVLTSHACHGGLFNPGDADLVRMGDRVLVANFSMEEPDVVPVCAGSLHGPPRWREARLHDGQLAAGVGGVYFRHSGGADGSTDEATYRALDESLRPVGSSPPSTVLADSVACKGLTGTMRRHTEELGGQMVVSMIACCGDEGGGLFVCRAP